LAGAAKTLDSACQNRLLISVPRRLRRSCFSSGFWPYVFTHLVDLPTKRRDAPRCLTAPGRQRRKPRPSARWSAVTGRTRSLLNVAAGIRQPSNRFSVLAGSRSPGSAIPIRCPPSLTSITARVDPGRVQSALHRHLVEARRGGGAVPLRGYLLCPWRHGEPYQGVPVRSVCRPHFVRHHARQPTAAMVRLNSLFADPRAAAHRSWSASTCRQKAPLCKLSPPVRRSHAKNV
jgi:hypothetical protein